MTEPKQMIGTINDIRQSHNFIGITILIKKEDYQTMDPREPILITQDKKLQ